MLQKSISGIEKFKDTKVKIKEAHGRETDLRQSRIQKSVKRGYFALKRCNTMLRKSVSVTIVTRKISEKLYFDLRK